MLSVEDMEDPLASVVMRFVASVNGLDAESIVANFSDDAIVNDQLVEYDGEKQIREWVFRDVIGDRLSVDPVSMSRRYGNVVMNFIVEGGFDKSFLPSPLILTFYFSIYGDKIVQLIILRNQPAPDIC